MFRTHATIEQFIVTVDRQAVSAFTLEPQLI